MSKLTSVSLLTVTALYGLLVAVAVGICLACGISIIPALIGGIIVLLLQFLISPWLMDLTTKWLYKADFNKEIPDYLKSFIEGVCSKNNIKFPRIGIIDDGSPNCYTYGRTKKDARIILTRGMFELLSEDELKACVGHELGHVAHYDMLVMTVAQLIPIVFYAIYEASRDSSSSDSDNKSGAAITIIAYVLYIISQYIVLWLSRTREYFADSFSIDMTKKPSALAEALVKIGYGLTTKKEEVKEEASDEKDGKNKKDKNKNVKRDVSSVKGLGIFDKNSSKSLIACTSKDGESAIINKKSIKNAMKWEKWNYWAKWYEINSTHPLISKRLEAISNRSKEFNEEPYIVFDLVKEESYLDDFLIEILLKFLPYVGYIGAVVFAIIWASSENDSFKYGIVICGIVAGLFEMLLFFRRYKKNGFKESNVETLLGEVKVSGITPVPCTVKGDIIGRGDAGYIFSEDFVIRDKTGIIFLDYNQPLWLINKIFAVFKAKSFIGKEIIVKGWYRRSPVPYIEIYSMEVDGKVKKVYSYIFKLIGIILITCLFLILLFI